jgi:hypothetical protein
LLEFLQKPPEWLTEALPEGANDFLESGGWWAVLGFAALIALLIVWAIASRILRLFQRREKVPKENLLLDLKTIPDAVPSTGDRRLTVDGVPVRVRLVVVAPAGTENPIDLLSIPKLLDRVVLGLGEMVQHDQALIRVWPVQYSHEGFINTFHRNTPIPEGEREPSRWVLVAGLARIGEKQVNIGLGLQAIRPTSLGRRTLKMHEWPEVLRIKVRE